MLWKYSGQSWKIQERFQFQWPSHSIYRCLLFHLLDNNLHPQSFFGCSTIWTKIICIKQSVNFYLCSRYQKGIINYDSNATLPIQKRCSTFSTLIIYSIQKWFNSKCFSFISNKFRLLENTMDRLSTASAQKRVQSIFKIDNYFVQCFGIRFIWELLSSKLFYWNANMIV